MLIVPRILEAIRDEIIDKCKGLPDLNGLPNPFELADAKVGRYYQDPKIAAFRASVIHGDLEETSYPDGIFERITHRRKLAVKFESREIGGGEVWLRRGTVRLEFFFMGKKYSEEDAREAAYIMADNVFNAVRDMPIHLVKVDNEHAHNMFVVASEMLQTGGPPSDWIFRGKLYWEVQTEIF